MAPDLNKASGSASKNEAPSKAPPSKKKEDKKDEDLSEEDLALKQQLELYVERVQDPEPGIQKLALESLRMYIMGGGSFVVEVLGHGYDGDLVIYSEAIGFLM
ncbi:hypothetical protein OIU76_028762 [Salix suchowensis]|nr:hypothetical protein OIU76_028762 [Salix suchowensis]